MVSYSIHVYVGGRRNGRINCGGKGLWEGHVDRHWWNQSEMKHFIVTTLPHHHSAPSPLCPITITTLPHHHHHSAPSPSPLCPITTLPHHHHHSAPSPLCPITALPHHHSALSYWPLSTCRCGDQCEICLEILTSMIGEQCVPM